MNKVKGCSLNDKIVPENGLDKVKPVVQKEVITTKMIFDEHIFGNEYVFYEFCHNSSFYSYTWCCQCATYFANEIRRIRFEQKGSVFNRIVGDS